MNTATRPYPTRSPADRFRGQVDVPDPPRDAAGRKPYWEDTVAGAVAELRRRLASGSDDKSFQALKMILDLENARLRHKTPGAGTETGGGYSSPLPPMEECEEPKEKAEDLTRTSGFAPSATPWDKRWGVVATSQRDAHLRRRVSKLPSCPSRLPKPLPLVP